MGIENLTKQINNLKEGAEKQVTNEERSFWSRFYTSAKRLTIVGTACFIAGMYVGAQNPTPVNNLKNDLKSIAGSVIKYDQAQEDTSKPVQYEGGK